MRFAHYLNKQKLHIQHNTYYVVFLYSGITRFIFESDF